MLKRCLLCLTSYEPRHGGIASVNRNILRALHDWTERGHTLEIRSLVYNGEAPPLPAEYGDHFHPYLTLACRSKRWLFAARFAKWAAFWRPDLVVVDHLHLSVVPYLFRWLLPNGYVLFCHGIEFDSGLSRLRCAAYRAARLRLCNSAFTADRLRGLFPGADVRTCELGLEEIPAAVSPTLQPLRFPDSFGTMRDMGPLAILIVARLAAEESYKGHDEILALMPRLVERCPGCQFVIVGQGNDLERYKEVGRRSGVGERILFPGFVSRTQLRDLLEHCRLFAMPSRKEGFGLVYLEAMRFAKPCIASILDGGREVVQHEVTGFLVDPDNADMLFGALLRLLTDDELARRLGRQGLERLERRFRFEQFAERLRVCLDLRDEAT